MAPPKNVCGTDRKLRAVLGVVLAVIAVKLLERDLARRGTAVSVAAGEFIYSTLFQFCPFSFLLGIDTCEDADHESAEPPLRETVRP